MLSTPKKSTTKTLLEESLFSPPSKRDTDKQNKQYHQQLLNSNMKKTPQISYFDNIQSSKNNLKINNNEQPKPFGQQQQQVRSAAKNYSYNKNNQMISPFILKNQNDIITQQRLFTIQTNKYYQNNKEFENNTTPKKKQPIQNNPYNRSLFSSDSSNERGENNKNNNNNINKFENQINKENYTQKSNKKPCKNVFAATSIPSQKINYNCNNNFNQYIHQSARKVNPFQGNSGNKQNNDFIARENRQMNTIIHQRNLQMTPKRNKNNNNVLFPSSPSDHTDKYKGNGIATIENYSNLSPVPKSQSSKQKKITSQRLNKLSNSIYSNDSDNNNNNHSNNNQNNPHLNSCSSFNMNNQSTGSSGYAQIQNNNNNNNNSYINSTPTKKGQNRFSNPKLLFKDDNDRFEQDYEILQVLGSGYFGTVYKCLNKLDNNIYAVKVTKEQIRGENSEKQILKEAQALAALSACDEIDYIVRYNIAWIEDRQLHLAMEYCDCNLDHYQLPEMNSLQFYEQIKKIFQDVVKGLHYLHTQNLVHLDLKPENILLNKKQNKFKIADLGLALIQSKDHEGYSQITEGDARYLAKEVLNYYEATDLKKADIFSLGAMMYHLVTQTPLPTNGDEWLSIRQGILPKLDELISCPRELKNMIKQMMNPDPELRLSTQEILDSPYMKSNLIYEIKWQKIYKNILISSIQNIEKLNNKSNKRRHSINPIKNIHFN